MGDPTGKPGLRLLGDNPAGEAEGGLCVDRVIEQDERLQRRV